MLTGNAAMKLRYIRGLNSSYVPPATGRDYSQWLCASCLYNVAEEHSDDPAVTPVVVCSSLKFRGRQAGRIMATVQKYQERSCPGYRDIKTTIDGRAPLTGRDNLGTDEINRMLDFFT